MSSAEKLTRELKELAAALDIDLFGIARIDALDRYGKPGRRPSDIYPDVQAIVVFATGVLDSISKSYLSSPDNLVAEHASSALSEDMQLKSLRIRSFLRRRGYYVPEKSQGLLESGIHQRYAFQQAGLGYVGKSQNAVSEKYGPRMFIGTMLTNAPLVPDEPYEQDLCGDCTVCETFCMSKALIGERYFHQRQCESVANSKKQNLYYSLGAWHNCDMCHRVCPRGTVKFPREERRGDWWEIMAEHEGKEIARHSKVR